MLSTLLGQLGAPPQPAGRPEVTRESSSETILSTITVNASHPQSSSSTPPTSIDDGASLSSTSLILESTTTAIATVPAALSSEPSGRSRRARASVGTYNVKVLSGTAIHAPRKYLKNLDGTPVGPSPRRKTISGGTLAALKSANGPADTVEKKVNKLARDGLDALDMDWSVKRLPTSKSEMGTPSNTKKFVKQLQIERRKTMKSSLATDKVENLSKKLSVLGKRGRKTFEEGLAGVGKVRRELLKLQDTPEFAKIDKQPVVHEVWSNGKLLVEERPKKKKKMEEAKPQITEEEPKPAEKVSGKKQKVWLTKGLYAGQNKDFDWFSKMHSTGKPGNAEKRSAVEGSKPRNILPLPLWHGQRLLQTGRDFKLPFDICSPLPPGQPKPDEWRKTSSNRFIGDAAAHWKKADIFDSFSSKCVCTPDNGCDERCQNRIMLYECDDSNCSVGRAKCGNRSFTDLQERRKGGGKYRIGVEVIKTADRGYGVRSNRCFKANQIIVEYTGEIITDDECDRRMNEVYKNNECYYLMSFDQTMILDGTKGSIARFVNHSCRPNCRMVKWIVGGKPRMALFAGDNPIMTGDELTYDYNFDPFSAKNVQACRCGSDNCRGVLGPKPKDPKPVKDLIKDAVKAGVKAGKRKLKEYLVGNNGEDIENAQSPKKRKMKAAKGVKRSASSSSMKVASGAVKTIRKTISSASIFNSFTSKAPGSAKSIKTTKIGYSLKTYGKAKAKVGSKKSSFTMVESPRSCGTPEKMSSVGKRIVKKSVARSAYVADQASPSRVKSIRVIPVSDGEEE